MSDGYTPEQDERLVRYLLVRYMAMVTPVGYQSALTVVQEMTKMLAIEENVRQVAERAWNKAFEAVTNAAPDDVWFASWDALNNPYSEEAAES